MSSFSYSPPSSLRLPMSTLLKLTGFSIDFGGSGIKLAYLPKEEWERKLKKGQTSKDHCGELHLKTFPRENMDTCIEFIKNNCYVKKPISSEEKPVINCSGVGSYQFSSQLEEKLNIKLQINDETQSNQAGLDYLLNHFSVEEFCVPVPIELSETVRKNSKDRVQMMLDWNKSGATNIDLHPEVMEQLDKQHDPNANVRPCLMASFGSNWMVIRFGENGSVSMVNFNTSAGRSFLGLGNLLTGAKTYEELMDLAEKGNSLNLDMTEAEITSKVDPESQDQSGVMDEIYGKYAKLSPRPTFLWGKAVASDTSKFKKEDIARALLYTMCHNLVTVAFDACVMTRTKHIFIHGNFVQHPLTQRIVWEEFEHRKWQATTFALPGVDGDYHFHILKHGSHLGAIGSLFKGHGIK